MTFPGIPFDLVAHERRVRAGKQYAALMHEGGQLDIRDDEPHATARRITDNLSRAS